MATVLSVMLLWGFCCILYEYENPSTFLFAPLYQMLAAKRTVVSCILGHLLFVVSFHWNVEKLVYLETLLDTTRTYETRVDVVIVTDNGPAVERVLRT